MLSPHHLRTLAAFREWGTITAAAESMGYSPSAVSQQLAALQQGLGVELLRSQGRNVALTRAGETLAAQAPKVFAALERAEAATRAAAEASNATVRLGALGSTIIDLIPAAVAHLRQAAPELTLEVVDLGDDVLSALRARRVDVAVDHHWSNVAEVAVDGLAGTRLCEEPVHLLGPVGTALDDPAVRATCSWVDHPCAQCGPAARNVLRQLGLARPSMPFETDDMIVMLHLAALGAAATVSPGLATLHRPVDTQAWLVDGVTRTISAHIRDATTADPSIQQVVTALRVAGQQVQDQFAAIDAQPATATSRPPT